jgi:hypothetical protein
MEFRLYQHLTVPLPIVFRHQFRQSFGWRALLNGSVIDGRQILREVLAEPFQFSRDGRTYRFSAPVITGHLIAGMVLPTKVASPRGYTLRWKSDVAGIAA